MISLASIFGKDAAVVRDPNFQLLLLANVLGPMGSGIVSPLLDTLTDTFAVTAADIGLVMSMFSAPAIVMIPLAGLLTDRFGRKPVLVTGMTVFGIAGVAIAFTTDFRVVLLLRLVQGAGFSGIVPVIITSIGDLYAGSTEATAQGIRFMGAGLSQTLFPLLSGVLVVIAWQYPFFIHLVALPIALVVLLWFEEPTDDARPGGDGAGFRSQLGGLRALLRNRHVRFMVLARGLPVMVWIGFLTYNSIVVVDLLSGTPTQAGALVAVGSLSMAVSASQAGRVTSYFAGRVRPLLVSNLALGAGFAGMVLAPTLPVAYGSIAVAGFGFGITLSLYRSIITGLATASLRGSLVSTAEAFGRVTSTLTPILMGAAIAVGTPAIGFAPAVRATGLAVAVLAGLGGILCILVVSVSPLPDAAPEDAGAIG